MQIESLLSPTIEKWLNKSVQSELYASNLYKHLANHLQRLGYFGTQSFYLAESADELKHYQKIVEYANDMGFVISIPAIEAITEKISSIEDALNISYETELDLLKQYKDFYKIAEDEEDDCTTAQFLLNFIEIQRKAVGEYGDLIVKYARAKENKEILLFDSQMAK